MGYLDPRTGEWMNDDGTVAPGGLIGQQDGSNSPPLIPPPPDPNAPPEPLYYGPQEETGDRAPSVGPVGEPGPNDVLPPGFGQEGSNAAPILDGGAPEPWKDPWAPEPEAQVGEPTPPKFGAEMVPAPAEELPGQAPPPGELPPGPEAQVGEPSAPKFGADMVPPGADLPTGAPLPPDSGTPPAGSLPNLQLPEPTLGAAAPAGPDLGVPNLTPPDVGGIAPPADLKLSEPMADTVTPGSMPAPGELPAAAGAPAVPTKPEVLEAEAESNRKEQGALDIEKAKGNLAAANKIADLKAQAQKDAQKIIDQGQNDLAAARAQQKEDYDKYRAMGEKSVWGDNPTRNMILTGIAMIVGARVGLGFKMSSFVVLNAVNGLEQKKQADIAMQAKILEHDGKNVDQIQEATAKKLADWQVQKAAGLDATVSRAEAEMAARGIPQATIDANKDIIALRSAAETAKEKADLAAHKIAEDKIKDDLNTRKTQAEIDLMNARAAALAKKTKGGGVGGSAMDQAAVAWTKAVQEGVPDATAEGGRRPMTTEEKQQKALDLHIPLTGKATQISYEKLNKDVAFDATQQRQGDRAGLQGNRLLSKETNDWAKANGVAKIIDTQAELSKVQKVLRDNPGNGLAQALAVEKAVSAARGGAASKQALNLALEHLGGSLDEAEGTIAKIRSGAIGAKQMANFTAFINGQLGAAQAEGKDKYDDFNKYIESQPPERKPGLIAQRGRLFSGMDGFGGKSGNAISEAGSAKPSAAPPPNVIPIRTLGDQKLRMQALATPPNDPNYASAQRWLAAHGIVQ
jgi:hypothetical protein